MVAPRKGKIPHDFVGLVKEKGVDRTVFQKLNQRVCVKFHSSKPLSNSRDS